MAIIMSTEPICSGLHTLRASSTCPLTNYYWTYCFAIKHDQEKGGMIMYVRDWMIYLGRRWLDNDRICLLFSHRAHSRLALTQSVSVCACVRTHVHTHTCLYTCDVLYVLSSVCEPVLCRYICKWNPEVNIWYLPSLLSTWLLGTNLPLNLNLTNSARLAGQQTAGVLSPMAPGLQTHTDRPALLGHCWGSELTPSGLSSQQFISKTISPAPISECLEW